MSQVEPLTQPAPTATHARPSTMSVVIPSYNNLPVLIRCLKSLYRTAWQHGQQGRLEILVQDDCSPSFNIYEVIGAEPAAAQRNPINLGFAGNCNAGAMRAKGENGLVLTSTVTKESRQVSETVNNVRLKDIRVPTLMVHHKQDDCVLTPYELAVALMRSLTQAPKKELITFTGGDLFRFRSLRADVASWISGVGC